MTKIYKDLEQGTDDWFNIKRGKLTASHAQAIATAGKGLETLVYEILAEKYSTAPIEHYTNEDMDRGHELEEQARQMFELETGLKIEQIGFVELDEYTGASPDGFTSDNGLIEIKAKKDSTYIRALIDNKIDTKYLLQIQMQMYVVGKKHCYFVDYNPNFEKRMNITKIEIDPVIQEKLKIGIEAGKKMLIEKEKIYQNLIK